MLQTRGCGWSFMLQQKIYKALVACNVRCVHDEHFDIESWRMGTQTGQKSILFQNTFSFEILTQSAVY